MVYLKSKQHYSDLYDEITVSQCRNIEKFHKEYKPSEEVKKKGSKKELDGVMQYILNLELHFNTGERYVKKEQTTREWIERDEAKDELCNSAEAPEDIRCLSCSSVMSATFKDFHDWGSEGKDRVLFMYDCPNKCLPRRAFFNDGEEWKPKPHICPKCDNKLTSSDKREKNKIITTESCSQCKYENIDELDLTHKEEKVDKNFEKDRARFCLSEEKGGKYIESKGQFEQMKKLVDEIKEREKNKDIYDKMAKIKKLTVVQLENTLVPVLEKNGYVKLELATPEMNKDIVVGFIARESKDDREEYDSKHQLRKLVQDLLKDTNWRLMSDGIHYRLGILQGRLRAYEREEDLVKLVI